MNSIYDCLKSVENSLNSATGDGDYLLEAYADVISELSEKLVECFSQLSSKSFGDIDAQIQDMKVPPVKIEFQDNEDTAQVDSQHQTGECNGELLTGDATGCTSCDLLIKEKQQFEEKIKLLESQLDEKTQQLEEKINSLDIIDEEKQQLEEKIKLLETQHYEEKTQLEENVKVLESQLDEEKHQLEEKIRSFEALNQEKVKSLEAKLNLIKRRSSMKKKSSR
ncbi:uncharacterized protein [Blastocystis hominis]|uniref:Uncharacterized protein n=1 Tax=Blastocystis hominis TaxID=12968 RepID=D8MAZ4_BLAHO|nr:uncharacterized protein [Blastocystis hominis]CBK25233.2 unnamed protein product [Blastocystis hominis]|eukprot:XP_012899281.1 uncharacterized protein [Blastocystis hominis]